MTTMRQVWWRCTGWPWGLVRYAWFKLLGVDICEQCWDLDGAAIPSMPVSRPPICESCNDAAYEQKCR